MRHPIIYSILLIVALLGANTIFQSSSNDREAATSVKDVTEFNRVVLKGRGNLHIMQADHDSLKLVGDKSVLKKVRVHVQYGELVIALKTPGWLAAMFVSPEVPDYYLHLKDLSSVKVLGSGTIETEGVVKSKEISFSIDGSGKVEAKVNGNQVSATIYGSGDMQLIGETADLNLTIQGSGKFLGSQLESKRANVTIEGAGDAVINVKDYLNVKVLGSGHVSYKGKPKIIKHVSGSGDVAHVK